MQNTFEVHIWKYQSGVGKFGQPDYQMSLYWQGENLFIALYKLWQAKREAHGYVKLEWR
jgi:hypothetical protein